MSDPTPLIAVPLTMAGSDDGLVCGPDGCAVVPPTDDTAATTPGNTTAH